MNKLVHHHLIYQAPVGKVHYTGEDLTQFLYDILVAIDMQCLIPPVAKLSKQNAWTGLIGIITSHISFHYWVDEAYVQLDIYSCKSFDIKKALRFLDDFWQATTHRAIFINRKENEAYKIKRIDNITPKKTKK